MADFAPLNLAQLYQGADQAVAQAMQTNLLVLQSQRMKQEFDTEDSLRSLAKRSTSTDESGNTTFNRQAFTQGAYGVDPLKAMAFEKQDIEAKKAALDITKTQTDIQNTQEQIDERRLKTAAERLKVMNEASTVPFLKYKELIEKGMPEDQARQQVQPLHEQAIKNVITSGLFPPDQLRTFKMPEQFDPTMAEAGMRQVLGAKDALAQYWEERKFGASERHHADSIKVQIRGQDITLRGQDLTDARAKEDLAIKGLEVKDNEDGTYSVVDKKTGQASPVLDQNGQPMKNAKGQGTDAERVAAGYATRMVASEKILGGIKPGDQKSGTIEAAAGMLPWVGEELAQGVRSLPLVGSADRQRALQAQMDWVRAKLRKESGAVIGPKEMVDEIKTYFPMVGDRPEVVTQKEEARKRAADSMVQTAGRAYKAPSDEAPKDAKPGSVSVTAPDGKTYNFPNQEAADKFKKAAGIQ